MNTLTKAKLELGVVILAVVGILGYGVSEDVRVAKGYTHNLNEYVTYSNYFSGENTLGGASAFKRKLMIERRTDVYQLSDLTKEAKDNEKMYNQVKAIIATDTFKQLMKSNSDGISVLLSYLPTVENKAYTHYVKQLKDYEYLHIEKKGNNEVLLKMYKRDKAGKADETQSISYVIKDTPLLSYILRSFEFKTI